MVVHIPFHISFIESQLVRLRQFHVIDRVAQARIANLIGTIRKSTFYIDVFDPIFSPHLQIATSHYVLLDCYCAVCQCALKCRTDLASTASSICGPYRNKCVL